MATVVASAVLSASRTPRAQTSSPLFTPEQLDQMLAPIALYPDALQAQVLMAATYPLEVVEAARWSKAHPGLKGNAAVDAVQAQDWDVSVKSLIGFPQVLAMMDEHLDWTQNLGNAVLAQQQDVADSIQRLRARAAEVGNLNNTGPLRVEYLGVAPEQTIVIEPVDPNIIYVPYYDPFWVYGTWPYPAYPPYYWRPLPVYGYGPVSAVGFMFGLGIAVSFALFGGWHWARHASYINIVNVDRVVRIDPHFDRARIGNGVTGNDRVQVEATNVCVNIGDARVAPGDLLRGDADGIVVIPRAHEAAVLDAAEGIQKAENAIREAVRSGMRLDEARRSFRYHDLQSKDNGAARSRRV